MTTAHRHVPSVGAVPLAAIRAIKALVEDRTDMAWLVGVVAIVLVVAMYVGTAALLVRSLLP